LPCGNARAALEAQMAALQKTRRGQQLGEISLAEVLLAERMMHDAFHSEVIARSDAQRAITKSASTATNCGSATTRTINRQ
jgi:hypothetical protein